MKSCLCLLVMVFLTWSCAAAEITVVKDGRSDYEIVVSSSASESASEGAQELIRLIKVASGVSIPLVNSGSHNRKQIVVGDHSLASKAGIDINGLSHDSFIFCVKSDTVYLIGTDDRVGLYDLRGSRTPSSGSYYAVMEFARRFMGVEWYMPGPLGEEIPHLSTISIPSDFYMVGKPRFAIRFLDAVWSHDPVSQEQWRKAGWIKGHYFNKPANDFAVRWGKHLRVGCAYELDVQHAWYMFVPADKPNQYSPKAYGEDHPEYFALRDGKRITQFRSPEFHGGCQLCVSNTEVARVYAENVVAYSKRTGIKNISLSCNDGGGHCQCEQCTGWDYEKDQGQPVLTDRLLRFANSVAEQVVKEIPDIRFGLYAYHESRRPPMKTVVHPSIVISDVYNDLPYVWCNKDERSLIEQDIRNWRQKSEHVVLTTYYTGYGHWSLPWSTTDTLGSLVQILAGLQSSEGIRFTNVHLDVPPMGTMGPDYWIMGQLLWDPNQSLSQLKANYYNGAFGREAGVYIQQYFDKIHQSMTEQFQRNGYKYGNVPQLLVLGAYQNVREQCSELIQKAVQQAVIDNNERFRWRVDRVYRGWVLAEKTLDAVENSQAAQSCNDMQRQFHLWEKAVEKGRDRMVFASSVDSLFAVSALAIEMTECGRSLGVVTEIPLNAGLTLEIPKTAMSVTVDGKMDEELWQTVSSTPIFKDNNKGGEVCAETNAYIAYDNRGLFVGFKCAEPCMPQMKISRDVNSLWEGDVIELFLSEGSAGDYLHFSINPDGLSRVIRAKGDQGVIFFKSSWQYAAYKDNDHWSAEMFIPWRDILSGDDIPQYLKANFCRERFTCKTELSAWAPTNGPFAQVARFGLLKFIK